MTAAHVRSHYGIDYKTGERVVVDGRPGIIVSFPGQYLGVRFDGEKRTSRCHPTWRVERTGVRYKTTTLPNCDRCGQFTSQPDVRRSCDSYSDYHVCWELLICPRCAEREAKEKP